MRYYVTFKAVLIITGILLPVMAGHAQEEMPIQFGQNVFTTISANGEEDSFTFEADVDDVIVIRVVKCEGFRSCGRSVPGIPTPPVDRFTPRVQLRDPSDTIINQNISNVARIGPERLPSNGTYSITVDDPDCGAGNYALFLQRVNDPDRTEPLIFGDDLLISLNSCGEVDTYTFESGSGIQATIDMVPAEIGNLDPRLELYDDGGRALSVPGGGHIEQLLTATGNYTVLATSVESETGTYRINLSVTPSPVSGSVMGMSLVNATCRNETTGQVITIPLNGTTSWNCEDAGLLVNNGDKVFTGAEGEVGGEILPEILGIFSEMTEPRLMPDQDSFIGIFEGGDASFVAFEEDTVDIQEGTLSLRSTISVNASQGGFAGWFVSWGTEAQAADDGFVRDMSAFTGGRLIFWVKSSINLEVGIRSGNVVAGTETSKTLLSQVEGFVPDDTWQQLCIPLSTFAGFAPKADFRRIKVFFVVASNTPSGGTGESPQTFLIDDVRWESLACP